MEKSLKAVSFICCSEINLFPLNGHLNVYPNRITTKQILTGLLLPFLSILVGFDRIECVLFKYLPRDLTSLSDYFCLLKNETTTELNG